MNGREENNQVQITGEVIANFTFNHEMYGEKFYEAFVRVPRSSGVSDQIPIMVSERLLDVMAEWRGCWLNMTGQLRTYNAYVDGRVKLRLHVFVREVESVDLSANPFPKAKNLIELDGYLCKAPIYRKTPLGREIADLLLAVNRPYSKSDYIPCICWGRTARHIAGQGVGTRCILMGRIQSREYTKLLEDGGEETRVAWEVSVGTLYTER